MMLAALRRSRLLTGLLFIASPAVGGTLLPAVHPCPVDAPWLTQHSQDQSAAGHHHGGEHDAPAKSHEHQTCHCIGSWLSATAVAPPAPALISRTITVAAPVLLPAHDSSLDLGPLAALLPPATAPPLL